MHTASTAGFEEYHPPHKAQYLRQVASHKVITDPPSRHKIEGELSEFKEREEDRFAGNDQGSFYSTYRERSLTSVASKRNLSFAEGNLTLKSRDFFRQKLKAQNIVKNLPLVLIRDFRKNPSSCLEARSSAGLWACPFRRRTSFSRRSCRE